ncbi:NADase-type glycan-binding domain-containing protein [Streptomyces sp. NPDC055078]
MTTPENCPACGTRAEVGQSFCDSCGAVLSWTNRQADRQADRSAPAAPGARSGDAPARRHGAASGGPGRDSGAGQGSAAPSAGAGSGAAGAGDGWDAFSRPSGGAGLAPGARNRRNTGTAASAIPDSSPYAPGPSRDTALTGAGDGSGNAPATAAHRDTATGAPPATARHTDPQTDPQTAPYMDPYLDPNAPYVDPNAPTEPLPPATPAPAPPDTDAGERARRLLVPLADPEPGPPAPSAGAPVLPGRPAPRHPQAVRPPGEEPGTDGGTPCPWCATRNRPDRHYCVRCAMPMTGDGPGPARVRLPWWRRLPGLGHQETPWAGDRPRPRRTLDRVLSWLGWAVVLALLITLAVNIPQMVQATRDHFAKRAPVAPDRFSASRSYPGHQPQSAFDKINNTWWGPGVSHSGQGEWIEARFDRPTRLLDLIITPGVSRRADQISQQAHPHRIKAHITLADGKTTTTRTLTLDQGAGDQRRAFRVGEVSAVRFTIESAYGVAAKKQVAIAEIEFFGPSQANAS